MSILARAWIKLPVVVRAIVGGLATQVVGFVALITLLPLNFRIAPEVPWALVPLGVALWAYWSYFGGRGWPRSTADARHRLRRSRPVGPASRPAVVVVGGLFGTTLFVIAILQHAAREVPPEALGLVTSLASLPPWSSIPLALGAAFFVGVTEEMSYRGYMQVPIERRHGPVAGLLVPALVFALSHGIDPWVVPVFFLVSTGWSALAWCTDSVRPGIVVHTIVDATAFVWAILRPGDVERLAATNLASEGLTPGYLALAIVALALSIATIGAFRTLHRRTTPSRVPSPRGATAG